MTCILRFFRIHNYQQNCDIWWTSFSLQNFITLHNFHKSLWRATNNVYWHVDNACNEVFLPNFWALPCILLCISLAELNEKQFEHTNIDITTDIQDNHFVSSMFHNAYTVYLKCIIYWTDSKQFLCPLNLVVVVWRVPKLYVVSTYLFHLDLFHLLIVIRIYEMQMLVCLSKLTLVT